MAAKRMITGRDYGDSGCATAIVISASWNGTTFVMHDGGEIDTSYQGTMRCTEDQIMRPGLFSLLSCIRSRSRRLDDVMPQTSLVPKTKGGLGRELAEAPRNIR